MNRPFASDGTRYCLHCISILRPEANVIQWRVFRLWCLPLILMCLVMCCAASAQVANNTSLVGTVTDESGNVVAGVKVRATNVGTSATYPATSNAEGYYSIDFI